jgi:hypothetical protein
MTGLVRAALEKLHEDRRRALLWRTAERLLAR